MYMRHRTPTNTFSPERNESKIKTPASRKKPTEKEDFVIVMNLSKSSFTIIILLILCLCICIPFFGSNAVEEDKINPNSPSESAKKLLIEKSNELEKKNLETKLFEYQKKEISFWNENDVETWMKQELPSLYQAHWNSYFSCHSLNGKKLSLLDVDVINSMKCASVEQSASLSPLDLKWLLSEIKWLRFQKLQQLESSLEEIGLDLFSDSSNKDANYELQLDYNTNQQSSHSKEKKKEIDKKLKENLEKKPTDPKQPKKKKTKKIMNNKHINNNKKDLGDVNPTSKFLSSASKLANSLVLQQNHNSELKNNDNYHNNYFDVGNTMLNEMFVSQSLNPLFVDEMDGGIFKKQNIFFGNNDHNSEQNKAQFFEFVEQQSNFDISQLAKSMAARRKQHLSSFRYKQLRKIVKQIQKIFSQDFWSIERKFPQETHKVLQGFTINPTYTMIHLFLYERTTLNIILQRNPSITVIQKDSNKKSTYSLDFLKVLFKKHKDFISFQASMKDEFGNEDFFMNKKTKTGNNKEEGKGDKQAADSAILEAAISLRSIYSLSNFDLGKKSLIVDLISENSDFFLDSRASTRPWNLKTILFWLYFWCSTLLWPRVFLIFEIIRLGFLKRNIWIATFYSLYLLTVIKTNEGAGAHFYSFWKSLFSLRFPPFQKKNQAKISKRALALYCVQSFLISPTSIRIYWLLIDYVFPTFAMSFFVQFILCLVFSSIFSYYLGFVFAAALMPSSASGSLDMVHQKLNSGPTSSSESETEIEKEGHIQPQLEKIKEKTEGTSNNNNNQILKEKKMKDSASSNQKHSNSKQKANQNNNNVSNPLKTKILNEEKSPPPSDEEDFLVNVEYQ